MRNEAVHLERPLESVDLRREPPRGGEAVGVHHELTNFGPIHAGAVKPETHPTAVAEVRGHKETIGVRGDKRLLVTRRGSTDESQSTVTVVIVGEVRECLRSNQERDVSAVLSPRPLSGLGKRGANLVELRLANLRTRASHRVSLVGRPSHV
jgi:hypothetical protein